MISVNSLSRFATQADLIAARIAAEAILDAHNVTDHVAAQAAFERLIDGDLLDAKTARLAEAWRLAALGADIALTAGWSEPDCDDACEIYAI